MYFSAFCTRGVTYSLPTKYCSSLLWTEHDQEAWTSRSASQDCDGLCGHTWTYRNCNESSSLSRNSFLFHVRAQPSGDCSNKPGWAAARSQLPLRGTRAPSAIMPCLTMGERLRQHPSHTGPWVQQGAARWAAHTAPTHFPPPEALRQLSYQAGGRTAAEAHTQTWEQPAPQPRRLSTHAASCKCGHFRKGFLSSCTLRPVERLANPRACYSTGKRKPRRGTELNDWKNLCSEGSEDYSEGLCSASMSALPRKCKALLPPPLGWSTKEPQSRGAATRSHEKPAEGGDGGPGTPSKYQMAPGICNGNEREGTNGTQACCVYVSCLLFFFFFLALSRLLLWLLNS